MLVKIENLRCYGDRMDRYARDITEALGNSAVRVSRDSDGHDCIRRIYVSIETLDGFIDLLKAVGENVIVSASDMNLSGFFDFPIEDADLNAVVYDDYAE